MPSLLLLRRHETSNHRSAFLLPYIRLFIVISYNSSFTDIKHSSNYTAFGLTQTL